MNIYKWDQKLLKAITYGLAISAIINQKHHTVWWLYSIPSVLSLITALIDVKITVHKIKNLKGDK